MELVTRLKNSQFVQSIAILATGTALAQAIPVLASPILTRLYTPSDFGLLALFLGIVSSISPAVCGRYEVASVLPNSDAHGKQVFVIALFFAVVISSLFLVFLGVAHSWIIQLIDAEKLGKWLYITAVALLLTGVFQAGLYYSNRLKRYKLMAKTKLVQAVVVVLISIILGMSGIGFTGLLIGNVLGLLLATGYIYYANRFALTNGVFSNWNKKYILMSRYREFPLFNASSSLLDGVTLSLPIFFLAHYFPDSVVGYFALVLRIANAPMSFISQSISQVNLKKVVDLVNERREVAPYLYKLTFILIAIVSIPTVLFILWAPELFSIIFGSRWHEAGVYCQILMPALAMRFVASTLSSTLGATKNNGYGALWKVISFVVTLTVLAWFAPEGEIIKLLIALLISDFLLYVLYYLFIVMAAKRPRNLL